MRIQSHGSKKTKIVVDSYCSVPNAHIPGRGGRGKAACGGFITDEHGKEHEFGKYLSELTVPQAEFHALILGLEEAPAHTRGAVEVWTDSELVC